MKISGISNGTRSYAQNQNPSFKASVVKDSGAQDLLNMGYMKQAKQGVEDFERYARHNLDPNATIYFNLKNWKDNIITISNTNNAGVDIKCDWNFNPTFTAGFVFANLQKTVRECFAHLLN